MLSQSFTRRYAPLLSLALLAALLLPAIAIAAPAETRYGAFGLLDQRSRYGRFWFPEPLRVEEMDLDNELRFDWVHQAGEGTVADEAKLELEKAFGLTTLELEVPYERESEKVTDPATSTTERQREWGAGNLELGLRRPVVQYVSPGDFVDNTVGVGFELALPTNSPVSKNTEAVLKLFDTLRLGEHLSLQAIGGYSVLFGPGPDGGAQTFEYGVVAGYGFEHQDLPIPHVAELVPLLELTGETALNHEEAGHNSLSGTLGVRAALDTIGSVQPRIGLGYVFPVDQGARDEFDWGLITSLVFEY